MQCAAIEIHFAANNEMPSSVIGIANNGDRERELGGRGKRAVI